MEFIIYLITAGAFFSAITCAWSIVSFLENNEVIKKNTPLRLVSWGAFYKYYQIKKEQDGSYGLVGIIYLVSLSILLVVGIIFLVENLLKPL